MHLQSENRYAYDDQAAIFYLVNGCNILILMQHLYEYFTLKSLFP
jgi:hypothetical protein